MQGQSSSSMVVQTYFFQSCSQDQQCQDQDQLSRDQDKDWQTKHQTNAHCSQEQSISFINVVKQPSLLYISQSTLNFVKFFAVFVIYSRKMDYNFTTHTY